MRLRNVKNAKEKIENSIYTVNNPKEYKGLFHKLFNNDNDIEIEIGMGKGDFIINKARQNPNINYIGIEKFDSVLVRAIEKLENEDISNLKLMRVDALEITDIFDREISTLYLNFSDPWPKERHEKRRLTSEIFLNRYNTIFKDKKNIIMKTDNRSLFEYSLKSFTNNDYKIVDISLNLHQDMRKDNVETEYEHKFASRGDTIYMVNVSK